MNQQKKYPRHIFFFLAILATILLTHINAKNTTAKTPPYATQFGALPKPENFIIHLPWASGESDLHYRSYGDVSHTGKDFFAVDFNINGAMVHPTASGKVIFTKTDPNCSECYGNYVIVEHTPNFPNYVSVYAHLADILVTTNQEVDLNTQIGHEGNTGTPDQHLHFALMYCTNVKIDQFPEECVPVVPEPILGREIYEGLDWWHELHPDESIIAEHHPDQDASLPSGYWGENATKDGENIAYGESVVFHVHYSDESEIGEVRLTAYYPNWAEQQDPVLAGLFPEQVWRIIGRCNPDTGGCGENEWRFEWYPHSGDNGYPSLAQGLLDVPWLPKANPPTLQNNVLDLCISFDIFDKTGNPKYSPGDPRCSINTEANRGVISASTGNEARLIHIEPLSGDIPTPDEATFIADITFPDGAIVSSGQPLVKTWRMRDSGSTTWGNGYKLVFVGGEQMGAPREVNVPTATPGQEIDISVNLTAPTIEGGHKGYWQLRNPQGTYFGPRIFVDIVVQNDAPPPSATDYSLKCNNCPSTVEPGATFRPVVQATIGSGQLLESRGDMLLNTDGNLYGAHRHVMVYGVVNPGEPYDFTFYSNDPITAPNENGAYETKWRLWQNGQYVGPELIIQFEVQRRRNKSFSSRPNVA